MDETAKMEHAFHVTKHLLHHEKNCYLHYLQKSRFKFLCRCVYQKLTL
jgi:hypothetical protein